MPLLCHYQSLRPAPLHPSPLHTLCVASALIQPHPCFLATCCFCARARTHIHRHTHTHTNSVALSLTTHSCVRVCVPTGEAVFVGQRQGQEGLSCQGAGMSRATQLQTAAADTAAAARGWQGKGEMGTLQQSRAGYGSQSARGV